MLASISTAEYYNSSAKQTEIADIDEVEEIILTYIYS